MSYKTDKPPCVLQPDNMGIGCTEPGEKCARCGWNPSEAERRRKETIKRIEEKEKENEK